MCIIGVMKEFFKKFIGSIFILIIFLFLGLFFKNKLINRGESFDQRVLGFPEENKKEIDINFNNSLYRINWYEVNSIDDLTLTVNFGKYTSSEFFDDNSCKFLSSGGYYKSDYSPTGLLISEYKEISPFVTSSLADGIFSINDFATPRITKSVPRDRLRIALQSGPLLKENGEFVNLTLRNDEKARRVVLGVTGENKAVFMIVYNPSSVLIGPLLKDLPQILLEFEKKTGIIFADLVNLDGGAPTAFITETNNLTESTLVGSFFCLK
jgi:hypothetical protein